MYFWGEALYNRSGLRPQYITLVGFFQDLLIPNQKAPSKAGGLLEEGQFFKD